LPFFFIEQWGAHPAMNTMEDVFRFETPMREKATELGLHEGAITLALMLARRLQYCNADRGLTCLCIAAKYAYTWPRKLNEEEKRRELEVLNDLDWDIKAVEDEMRKLEVLRQWMIAKRVEVCLETHHGPEARNGEYMGGVPRGL